MPNPPTVPPGFGQPIPAPQPQFGEPAPWADPTRFLDQKSDSGYFRLLNKTLLQRVPPPRDPSFTPDKLILKLAQALGDAGPTKVKTIQAAGQIVFHSVGDTGPTKGPANVAMVADKMIQDFSEANPADIPAFFFHLWRRDLQLRRRRILLRPVLRALPGLPGAHLRHPRQPRWDDV